MDRGSKRATRLTPVSHCPLPWGLAFSSRTLNAGSQAIGISRDAVFPGWHPGEDKESRFQGHCSMASGIGT